MKSLKYIIVLGIVTGVTFSSCEDWLDENPKYSVDNTVIFDSEETAKQAECLLWLFDDTRLFRTGCL